MPLFKAADGKKSIRASSHLKNKITIFDVVKLTESNYSVKLKIPCMCDVCMNVYEVYENIYIKEKYAGMCAFPTD
jgi:hypothetical protein